jgi:hypothetical protein
MGQYCGTSACAGDKEGNMNTSPNIVFILVDNVGWGNFGVYGGTISTPRIDQLANQGIRGILCYEYNLFIIQRTKIRAKDKLPTGRVKIEIQTNYVAPRPGGPLKVTLTVNGNVFAEGEVPISAPLVFTANDCLDIGMALGSPVSLDYSDRHRSNSMARSNRSM